MTREPFDENFEVKRPETPPDGWFHDTFMHRIFKGTGIPWKKINGQWVNEENASQAEKNPTKSF